MSINLLEEDSLKIEKITYEYQSSLNILSYLLKENNINEYYLNEYFKKSELYFIELKELENIIFQKYNLLPNILNKNYYFDFLNHILYIEEK